jgi:zinc transporter, ZIP family
MMTDIQIMVFGVAFIFAMTTAGSALIFLFKKNISEKFNKIFLGFAAGEMIAASVWSLLIPAIEQSASEGWGSWSFIPAAVGFIAGGLFLLLLDVVVPHFHSEINEEEGVKNKFNRTTKLFLAVTIHNIPEGLSVGFAFGAALALGTHSAFMGALGLALGIGIQNFPEGAAVSLPMKEQTHSNWKSFLIGTASGAVEPVAAVIGIILAYQIAALLPWLLAFAAGAMIYVVVEELVPEAHLGEHSNLGTWGVMIGFVVMMILDVALG